MTGEQRKVKKSTVIKQPHRKLGNRNHVNDVLQKKEEVAADVCCLVVAYLCQFTGKHQSDIHDEVNITVHPESAAQHSSSRGQWSITNWSHSRVQYQGLTLVTVLCPCVLYIIHLHDLVEIPTFGL